MLTKALAVNGSDLPAANEVGDVDSLNDSETPQQQQTRDEIIRSQLQMWVEAVVAAAT